MPLIEPDLEQFPLLSYFAFIEVPTKATAGPRAGAVKAVDEAEHGVRASTGAHGTRRTA